MAWGLVCMNAERSRGGLWVTCKAGLGHLSPVAPPQGAGVHFARMLKLPPGESHTAGREGLAPATVQKLWVFAVVGFSVVNGNG